MAKRPSSAIDLAPRIELPEGIGQREGQVELFPRVVEVALEGSVELVGQLREPRSVLQT